MKHSIAQKIKRIGIAAMAAVLFVSSELSAYGALTLQETDTVGAEEEKEREVFAYPEANVYEEETESFQGRESGPETSGQEDREEPETGQPGEEGSFGESEQKPVPGDSGEPEQKPLPGVLGEEQKKQEEQEKAEESETEEDLPLLAPDLSGEAVPYAEEWEEPIETGMYYKTYRNPDGSFRTICTSTPNLYKDENGEEHPIDNTLVLKTEEDSSAAIEKASAAEEDPAAAGEEASPEDPEPSEDAEAEGVYVNTANSMRVELPAVIKPEESRGITIEEDGLHLVLLPEDGDYSRAAAEENAVRYNQVFENIDIQYTIQDTGIKEDIILLAPTERNSFSYLLKKDGFTAEEEEGRILIVPEGQEEPSAVLTAPSMSDAAGAKSCDLSLSLKEEEGAYRITVTADREWLEDGERVYPVKIDPNTLILKKEIVLIGLCSEYSRGTYDAVPTIHAGYKSGFGKCRLFVISGFLYPSIGMGEDGPVTITSASMHLYQEEKAGDGKMFCHIIDEPYSFSGAGSWNALVGLKHHAISPDAVVSGVGWKDIDITEAVSGWYGGIYESYGLMLLPEDETKPFGSFASECNADTALRPYYEINWKLTDEADPDYPLDKTTLTLRTIMQTDVQGRMNLLGVFADGMARPGSQVVYALTEDAGKYSGIAKGRSRTLYPNTESFESAFPKGSTRYRQGISNWQTVVPFTDLEPNKIYRLQASAVKDGKVGKTVYSEEFLKYKVTRYDTLPKIADYYGVPLARLVYDNRVQDMLLVEGNTLFIRSPTKNKNKPYQPAALTDADKAAIDAQLMGRGLHCEFGFEPVNLNTGNFYLEQEDSSVPGYGEALSVTRSYNSRGAGYTGPFGAGFSFAYDEQLIRKDDSTLLYRRGDGSTLEFTLQADGTYVSPAGYEMAIELIEDGRGEITNPTTEEQAEEAADGETVFGTYPVYRYELKKKAENGGTIARSFDSSGLLTQIKDEKGNAVTLTYGDNSLLESITSDTGQTYQFEWEDGHICAVTRPDGKKLAYAYNSDNELISYTDALGITLRYEYDDQHRMTAWYDGNGDRMVQNEYDDEGRVTKQTDGNGGVTVFSYQKGQTTTTDALGQKTVYCYDDQYRTKEIRYPDGTQERFTYTTGNQTASRTDRLGHTSAYTYDGRGNLLTETRFDGAVRTYAYDGNNRLISRTDYNGAVTAYEYDGRGNLTRMVRPDKSSLSYGYNGKNQLTSVKDPEGSTVTLSYTGADLTGIKDALGNQAAFAYDAFGNLISMTDPEGNTSRTEYDAEGRKLKETDALGGVTAYAFDNAGNVLSITDPMGNKTSFTYDANGNPLTALDPEGSTYTYTYDALNRRLTETLPDGTLIKKEYDTDGNCILETDGEDNAYTYRYDPLGNLLEETDPLGHTTVYTYDYRNNQMETRTDALGGVLRLEYDI